MNSGTSNDPVKTWRRYLSRGVSIDRFMDDIEEYVSSRARSIVLVRGRGSSLQGLEAVQQARIKVWKASKEKRIPKEEKQFFGYLSKIIRQEVNSYLENCDKKREFPEDVMSGVVRRACFRDDYIFLKDLPESIRKRVLLRLKKRFPRVNLMGFKFILDRILNGEEISSFWIKSQYGMNKKDFYVNSVLIAMRMEVYEMRDDVSSVERLFRETLYGSFVEKNL